MDWDSTAPKKQGSLLPEGSWAKMSLIEHEKRQHAKKKKKKNMIN